MFKKQDIIIYLTVLLLAGAAYLIHTGLHSRTGSIVRISTDGELIADYPLSRDLETTIGGYSGGNLKLVISGGAAYVESSSCPDKICVKHARISHTGESIICMPNRIVIEIISDDETPVIDGVS